MENLLFTVNAILPLIILVFIGWFIKKIKLIKEEFVSSLSKLCFYVLLPVLLFKNVYDADFKSTNYKLIGYILICVVAIFLITLVGVILFVKDRKKKGVILQAIFRSNLAFIGIPLATSLFESGTQSMLNAGVTVALISAFTIPLFNVLAVVSLSIFDEQKINFKKIFINIIKNPLIIGIVIGLIFNLMRTEVFKTDFYLKNNLPFLYKSISDLAQLASPLALIMVGGQFEFKATKNLFKYISVVVLAKMVIVPFLTLGCAILLGQFKNYELVGILVVFATPTAVASAIMAKEMDQDSELAGQLVVFTTLISCITIFIAVYILKSFGYL